MVFLFEDHRRSKGTLALTVILVWSSCVRTTGGAETLVLQKCCRVDLDHPAAGRSPKETRTYERLWKK